MGRNSKKKKAAKAFAKISSEFQDEDYGGNDTHAGSSSSSSRRRASSGAQDGVKIKYVNGEPTIKLGIKHIRGIMGFRELQRVDPNQEDDNKSQKQNNSRIPKAKKKVEEETVRGLGVVDLVNGKKELISHWGSLSPEKKQAILFVPKEEILGLFRYLQRGFDVRADVPKGSVIEKLQASFILHMEEAYQNEKSWKAQRSLNPDSFNENEDLDHVFFSMKEPSPPELAALMVLKGNLELSYARAKTHWNFAILLMFYAWYFSDSYVISFLLIAMVFFFTQLNAVSGVREYLCYLIDASFAAKGDPKYVDWKANWFLTSILLLTFSYVLMHEYIWVFLIMSVIPYALIIFEEEDPYQIEEILGEPGVKKWKHRLTFLNMVLLACFTYYEWEPLFLVAIIFFSEASALVIQLGSSLCFVVVLTIREITPRLLGGTVAHIWQKFIIHNRNVLLVAVTIFLLNVAVCYVTWGWEYLYSGRILRTFVGMLSLLWFPERINLVIVNYCLVVLSFVVGLVNGIGNFSTNNPDPSDESQNHRNFDFNKFQEERRRRSAQKTHKK